MFSRSIRSTSTAARRQRSVSLLASSHRLLKNITTRRAYIVNRAQPTAHRSIQKPTEIPQSTSTRIFLPPSLTRPALVEVNSRRITVADPDLAAFPLPYLREKALPALGERMLAAVTSVQIQSVSPALPTSYEIPINDAIRECPPTHLLACWSRAPAGGRRKVTIFPTHEITLAAYCGTLPPFPAAQASVIEGDSKTITVPVVPLCLPSAETFALLQTYLYSKRSDALLATLLPPGALTSPSSRAKLPSILASTTEFAVLGRLAMNVNGLWRNACALSVQDERLWEVIEFAWSTLVAAMHISAANGAVKQESL